MSSSKLPISSPISKKFWWLLKTCLLSPKCRVMQLIPYRRCRRRDPSSSTSALPPLYAVMRKVEEELARAPPPSKAATPEQELAKGTATVEQQLLLEP